MLFEYCNVDLFFGGTVNNDFIILINMYYSSLMLIIKTQQHLFFSGKIRVE